MAVFRRTLRMVVVTCCLLSIPAWAGIVPDNLQAGVLQFFGNNPGGQGLLSFDPTGNGGNGVLTIGPGNGANGGLITDLFGDSLCPLVGGVNDCSITGGYLTLTSGGETSAVVGGGSAFYTFGPGGAVDIYGSIPVLGIFNSLLLSASFAPNETFSVLGATGTFTGQLNAASILLDPALGSYAFVSGTTVETSLNLNLACQNGGMCTGAVDPVLQVQTQVPEPGTLALLGAGLFTFGAKLRGRRITR